MPPDPEQHTASVQQHACFTDTQHACISRLLLLPHAEQAALGTACMPTAPAWWCASTSCYGDAAWVHTAVNIFLLPGAAESYWLASQHCSCRCTCSWPAYGVCWSTSAGWCGDAAWVHTAANTEAAAALAAGWQTVCGGRQARDVVVLMMTCASSCQHGICCSTWSLPAVCVCPSQCCCLEARAPAG